MRIGWLQLWVSVLFLFCIGSAGVAKASGPHWIAGVNYFDPAAKGKPVVWANGQVSYYLDQGALSSSVSSSQAASLVANAAAVWNGVSTAAVSITHGGLLSEDVNGSNVTANTPSGTGAVLPADAQPTATAEPVAVIFDADGSVIDDIYGTDAQGKSASDPSQCTQTGVYSTVDSFSTAGNIAHALILVNGRCATSSALNGLLEYELVRAFGRVLGLDWSQVNESMWPNPTTDGQAGWPVMHPFERLCSGSMTSCMPNQLTLRLDDIAGLNQLYPVTSAGSGKTVTMQSTITVQGKVTFRNGQGMQGVNVVLTPLDPTANGNVPDLRYTVTAVTGAYYRIDTGNPVTGTVDPQGNPYGRFGTDDASKEGFFMLSGVPLPPGTTSANYQISIEPINPLYTGSVSVGPYKANQVAPSGAMQTVVLGSLSAGQTPVVQNFVMTDSADGLQTDDGVEAQPNSASGNGEWLAKLVGYGHTGWFQFHARANRSFTVEATSLDEAGFGTQSKSAVLIGLWSGVDAVGSSPDQATTVPFNGNSVGLTALSSQTVADGEVRVAFTDVRGDGRPDFTYRARVLYADSVFPARLTLAGGTIAIEGEGFRTGMTVLVNNAAATVTSVTQTEITAVAPAVNAATGTVMVAVLDPHTLGQAQILDGLSYDAQGTDGVRVVSGPSGTVSLGVPVPMTVQVVAGDGKTPAANVTVTYTVQSGSAGLGCGAATCTVVTNSTGVVTMMVTPTSTQSTMVGASIPNGGMPAVATFNGGGVAPQIAATNTLYVAGGGAAVSWTPVAVVLSNGLPVNGEPVQWRTSGPGVQVAASTSTSSNASGLVSTMVTVGSIAAGNTSNVYACEGSSGPCATFIINAEHADQVASLLAVNGAGQSLLASAVLADGTDRPAMPVTPVTLEVIDEAGRPLAGAQVNFYQQMDAWQPPCPAQGRCPAPQQISSLPSNAVSDANGLVTLMPLSNGGQPMMLNVLATTGQQGVLRFSIAQHP